ncbi:KIF21 [Mytilus coruscus]|uniref:KIF21 n=1 Tax=Mytilus coruscus TaxID=42192 RepID=A0A6J8A973_MYTCO|nr:KIF21 [Mytilus coruscus]
MKNEDVQKQSAGKMGGRITLNGMCAASALQILKELKERQQLTQSGVGNGKFYNSLQSPFKIAKYKDGLYEEADGTRIPILSIFRYLFSHFDDFRVCAELCNDVIEHCTSKSQTPTLQKTHWSLYEKVKATVFTPNQIEIHTIIKESDLEFLDTNWKENYSETEWDRIKLFEWNFQNSVSTKNRVPFESLIEKKYNFYELCKSVQENAESIEPIVVKTMKKNFARKTASNAMQGILVKGNMKHNPELIEKEILELIESYIAQDKVKQKQLNDQIYYSARIDNEEDLDISENCIKEELCQACFHIFETYMDQPLDIETFDILKEWTFNIPLPVRIFFENVFSEINGMNETRKSKIAALYCHFEAMLHKMNKHYSGITQDMNTDELLVNYHSVSTVFDVTSHLGITQSQETGDRRLKIHADPEMCYLFTFLKQYPVIYRNVEENEERMDNFIHLSFKTDPLPGENRTTQICTLPLTIKGIPRYSYQVQNWHAEECDGTNECICKEVKVLQKTDLNRTFLELYPEEEHVYNIFKQEATWPIYDLYEDLQMNNLITESQQAKENMESNVTETSIDQLNLTLESVHLDDEELNMSIANLGRSMGSLSVGSQMDRDEVSSQMGTSPNQLNGTLTIPTDEENTVEHNIFRHIEDISSSGLENIEDSEDKDLESPNLSAIDSDSDTLSLGDEYEIRLEENSENVREIEKMLGAISHIDTEDNDATLSEEVQKQLFSIFKTNPILTRHPSPASGRDDDIMVLKNVLDDILLKTEHGGNKERILFAPDFKITNNLFKLMDSSPKYRSFFQNQEASEIDKIMSQQHPVHKLEEQFGTKFKKYIEDSCSRNATFCIHKEMMEHCDEIIAIAVAERIGGPDGYKLLLASVKSSLPFSFLNGASSYAGFCSRLLLEHCQAGHFHSNFKTRLYTSPHYDSKINFGLDSIRADHRTAKKCIRPGSTLTNIIPKMSTVDKQKELHTVRKKILHGKQDLVDDTDKDDKKAVKSSASKYMEHQISVNDKKHIIRTVKLMMRRNAFNTEKDSTQKNIYHSKTPTIGNTTLDRNTYNIGKYLVQRYIAQQEYLGMTTEDCPSTDTLDGSKELINRVKRGQSVTVSRTKCKPKEKPVTETEKEEHKRVTKVKKLRSVLDSLSSKSNTCQAVLKPDGSKNATNKSPGVKTALLNLIKTCQVAKSLHTSSSVDSEEDQLVYLTLKWSLLTSETMPIYRIVICEEKYSFTPDDFKASTRLKREKKEKITIAHLKEENAIVSQENFSKKAAVSTMPGKKLISKFLTKQLKYVDLKNNLIVHIDSEVYLSECECQNDDHCQCDLFATPVRFYFKKESGYDREELMNSIKQRKGEAEMSNQTGCLTRIQQKIQEMDNVWSIL